VEPGYGLVVTSLRQSPPTYQDASLEKPHNQREWRLWANIGQPRFALWALLLIIVGAPLLLLLAISLNTGDPSDIIPKKLGLANYARVTEHWDWMYNTIIVAVSVTVLSTLIGVVLAWIMARTKIAHKGLITLLIILPYPMGPIVAALAWGALGTPNSGLINAVAGALTGGHVTFFNTYTVVGIILVQSLFQAPITFLLVHAALSGMDPSLEESSGVLGSGKLHTALRVTLPLMLPSILGAGLYAFVSTLGAFAIPAILGRQQRFNMVTNAVYILFSGYPADYPLAAVLGVVLVAITALAVFGVGRVLRRRSYAVLTGKAHQSGLIDVGRWRYLLLFVVYSYITIGVLLPLAGLIIASLQKTLFLNPKALTWTLHNYQYVLFEYPETRQAVTNSILLGVATGLIGIALAAMIAMVVEKGRRTGRRTEGLEQLAMAPQAVPRLIFSLALLWLILLSPIRLYGTVYAILLAYVIVFLPLGYRGIASVVSQVHPSLEEVARTLGATPNKASRSITVPLLRSGLAAGAALLFMISVSEVGASVLLSSTKSRVLGPTMFNFYDSGGLALVSALAVVQALIVLVTLIFIRRVSGGWMGTEIS